MELDSFFEDGTLHERSCLVLGAPDFHGLVSNDLRIGVGDMDIVGNGVAVHFGIVERMDATFLPFG